jgi:hypothetical protein
MLGLIISLAISIGVVIALGLMVRNALSIRGFTYEEDSECRPVSSTTFAKDADAVALAYGPEKDHTVTEGQRAEELRLLEASWKAPQDSPGGNR